MRVRLLRRVWRVTPVLLVPLGLLVLLVLAATVRAEIPALTTEDPLRAVRWSWRLEPASAAPGTEAELVLVAAVAPQWVVYSSDFKVDIGPRPARLTPLRDSTLVLLGPLRSIDARRKIDKTWNAEIGYFASRAELRQRVRLPADGGPVVATLHGQACFEANGSCHLIRQEVRIDTGNGAH